MLSLEPTGGKPRTTDLRPWLWGASLRGSSEHSPREIAVRGVHKVVTEKIISQGESRTHVRSALWFGVNALGTARMEFTGNEKPTYDL